MREAIPAMLLQAIAMVLVWSFGGPTWAGVGFGFLAFVAAYRD